MAPTFVSYGLFGAGYVGYMTFIIALLQKQGGSSEQMIWFWFTLGVVSTVSTLLWGKALGAIPDGRGPTLVFATAMLGTLPVLLYPGSTATLVSAILFGGSFLAGPTAITILGAAPTAGLVLDGSDIAPDSFVRFWTDRQPDLGGRDFRRHGKYRCRLLDIADLVGNRRFCEPVATSTDARQMNKPILT